MLTMTATEASRHFKEVLDRVERGESIVVTRGGRRVAVLGPAPSCPGRAVKDLIRAYRADPEWEREIAEVRDLVEVDSPEWDE
jgi:prevent-host-death family protein